MGYTPNIFQTQYGKLPPKNLEYPIFKQPQMEATPDTPVGLCIQYIQSSTKPRFPGGVP